MFRDIVSQYGDGGNEEKLEEKLLDIMHDATKYVNHEIEKKHVVCIA